MARIKLFENRRRTETGAAPLAVAYLANSFPSQVEPYVGEEIGELQKRGMRVVACSVWPTASCANQRFNGDSPVLTVAAFHPWLMLQAFWLCIARFTDLRVFFHRIISGNESAMVRARALAHTMLGAQLALQLRSYHVRQIDIHHGYMAAWIGMVAARLLKIPYSLTLHGSDLLLRPTFLDIKLQHCENCFTVSEFNRCHLLRGYPQIAPGRVHVRRMGVRVPPRQDACISVGDSSFKLLAVGRLHPVKDHAFLIRGCAVLKTSGFRLSCQIAGDGPERQRLANLIRSLHLEQEIQLLGQVEHDQLDALYREADLVVLTSVSEGIPLTLMEAMALGRPVIAPAITGIPELVLDGKTGFLYKPGSITSFVERVEFLHRTRLALGPLCQAAREHVDVHFNRSTNLQQFGDSFMRQIQNTEGSWHADSLLQQVQL